MTTATSAVGLARLPTALRDLLEDAAATAEWERTGDRITHDLQREVHARLGLGDGRAHVLRLTTALDDVTDAVDEAAHAMSIFADALPQDRAEALSPS